MLGTIIQRTIPIRFTGGTIALHLVFGNRINDNDFNVTLPLKFQKDKRFSAVLRRTRLTLTF
jgi:hypothetical protein